MTARSVIILSTHALPVRGRVQSSRILCLPPFAVCSMVMTTLVPGDDTRSIAPPIPLTILPGIIQFARSPRDDTCIAPRTLMSMWPPRIIPKLSSEEKKAPPGTTVTVSFPALIRSASSLPLAGNGPSPRMPFSDCSVTVIPSGIKLLASMGIPIPRLTYMPWVNSLAALRTMRSRRAAGVPGSAGLKSPDSLDSVSRSMRFSICVAFTMRFTKTPGT
mmetsp:Transcript_31031/g.81260  ORF Transcript_31031/g.81260 Transcript_31031/m.81260 type:complete len:218 (-) Transcript_31031:788-1441(-)